jgi:hypothetical protein
MLADLPASVTTRSRSPLLENPLVEHAFATIEARLIESRRGTDADKSERSWYALKGLELFPEYFISMITR